MALTPEQQREAIRHIEEGEPLPPDYKNLLFPPAKSEYELVYADKAREEDILANVMPVPLQAIRSFNNGHTPEEWVNKTIFGDNLQALRRLVELKRTGQLKNADGTDGVRLAYIDPPFATRREFAGAERAYQDKVIGAQFVEFLRKRLVLIRELLADDGSIYVHLDEKKSHYAKVILDEVFGEHRFQREIIWRIGWLSGYKTRARNWIRNHDVILFYTKSNDFVFNKEYIPYAEDYRRRDGKRPTGPGYPVEDTWNSYDVDRLDSIQIMSYSGEKTGFPTQKNENLLARIVRASSNEGDIVLDAFAGSGTTLAVAEKLGRKWVGIDTAKLAIYTIQQRMLNLRSEIGNTGSRIESSPFTVYNAGLYDFARLRELPREEWRAFALSLFEASDEPHKVRGIEFDGFRRGSDVLVFDHTVDGGSVLDHGFIDELAATIQSSGSSEVFIIAPAALVAFLEDYVDVGPNRFYVLRIPYSIINELHTRPFESLQQPTSEQDINATVEAVGFDFIQQPDIRCNYGSRQTEDGLTEATVTVKHFSSRSLLGAAEPPGEEADGRTALSLVLVDFDYPYEDAGGSQPSPPFEVDAFFFASDLRSADWTISFPLADAGSHVAIAYVDVYGNDYSEVKPLAEFR